MRLVVYPHSPRSMKVLLAVYEKGLTWIPLEVVPPYDEAAKAVLRVPYPLATVPILFLDDGTPMPESSIIVEYLDLTFPDGTTLMPRDPVLALRARAFDRLADIMLESTQYLAFARRKSADYERSPKYESTFNTLRKALDWVNRSLEGRRFLLGGALTFGDLGPASACASLLVDQTLADFDAWPEVSRWHAELRTRPSWRAMLEYTKAVPRPPGV